MGALAGCFRTGPPPRPHEEARRGRCPQCRLAADRQKRRSREGHRPHPAELPRRPSRDGRLDFRCPCRVCRLTDWWRGSPVVELREPGVGKSFPAYPAAWRSIAFCRRNPASASRPICADRADSLVLAASNNRQRYGATVHSPKNNEHLPNHRRTRGRPPQSRATSWTWKQDTSPCAVTCHPLLPSVRRNHSS